MRVLHGLALSALAVLAVAAESPAKVYAESGPLPAVGVSRSHPAVVRFDLYRGYLIVARGSIGPLKGLHFLLDTGAAPTVLDPRLAQKLHLEQQPAGIAVLGGRAQGARSIAPSLEFGPIQQTNVPVLIEDLSFLERALPVHIDAMIGLDVLGQESFVIDYASRAIGFGPAPPLSVSIPLRVKDGLAIVDAEVNHAPVHLLVDTGASSLILFETGMPGSVSGMRVSAVRRSTNMIGDFDRNEVWLHSLRLGEAELGKEQAFLVHNGAGQDFDGLMSPAALGITRVAVDLERGVLAFSR